MKYRVELDICFDLENNAISFLNLIENMKDKIFTGTGGEVVPIVHLCRYHKCFHDDEVPQPCVDKTIADLTDGEIVEHKNSSNEVVAADVVIPENVKTDIINS